MTLGNVLTFTDTGLTNGQSYYYKVSAVNSVGEGAKSNEASATPVAGTIAPKFTVSVSGSSNVVKNAAGTTVYTSSNAATAINYAINSLTSGRTTMEKVLLQGTFTISSSINIASYTILQSDTGTKITAANGMSGLMVTATGKSNFEIVGGEWNGNRANRTVHNDNQPFRFTNCSNVIISDLNVHDGCYDNIEFDDSSYITIANVDSGYSNWDNFMMAGCSNCLVDSCYIHDNAKGGCYFYCEDDGIVEHVDNNIMRDNTVERTFTSGLSVSLRGMEDVGHNDLIENNTCIDCGLDGTHPGINIGWNNADGLRLADNCTIRNNLIYETGAFSPPNGNGSGGGINVCATDSLITNNVIQNITDFGISVMGYRNTVSYNQISGVKTACYPGILLQDAYNSNIVYNTISNCPHAVMIYAGAVTDGCNNNLIEYNHFAGIANYMAFVHDKTCVGNIYENNTYQGTWQAYNNGTGTIIRNNTVG